MRVSSDSVFLPSFFLGFQLRLEVFEFCFFIGYALVKGGWNFAFVVCDFSHFEICHFCSEVFLVVRVFFGYAAFFKFFFDGFCASPCTEDFGGEFRHFFGEETADVFGVDAFEEVFFACFAKYSMFLITAGGALYSFTHRRCLCLRSQSGGCRLQF